MDTDREPGQGTEVILHHLDLVKKKAPELRRLFG